MRFGDVNHFQSTSESVLPSDNAVVLTTAHSKKHIMLHPNA